MNATRQRALAALAAPSRGRLLEVLRRSNRPLGIRELAGELGLHPNTVREHLRQLIEAGLVSRSVSPPAGRGRPSLRFVANADSAVDEDPQPYRALAGILAEELESRPDGAASAKVAGERWGRAMAATMPPARTTSAAMGAMVTLLDAMGFGPDAPDSPGEPIPLRRCPFGALPVGREGVICGVHLGLMRGALHQMEAPLQATRLEPFVRPDLCLAHFRSRADG